jgi:hypothetical protein
MGNQSPTGKAYGDEAFKAWLTANKLHTDETLAEALGKSAQTIKNKIRKIQEEAEGKGEDSPIQSTTVKTDPSHPTGRIVYHSSTLDIVRKAFAKDGVNLFTDIDVRDASIWKPHKIQEKKRESKP